MRSQNILVIESSEDYAAWLAETLNGYGMKPFFAKTVDEAEESGLVDEAGIILMNVEIVPTDRGSLIHLGKFKKKHDGICLIAMISNQKIGYAEMIGTTLKHGSPLVQAGADAVFVKEDTNKDNLWKEIMVGIGRCLNETDDMIKSLNAVRKSYQEMSRFLDMVAKNQTASVV